MGTKVALGPEKRIFPDEMNCGHRACNGWREVCRAIPLNRVPEMSVGLQISSRSRVMVIGGEGGGRELVRQWQSGAGVRVRHCRWSMRTLLAAEIWQPDLIVLDDRIESEQVQASGFEQALSHLFPLTPLVRASDWREECRFDIDAGYQVLGKIEFQSQRWGGDSECLGSQDWTELLVGKSLAMQQVIQAVGRFGTMRVPVLIQGEAGTGKRLVASALHASRVGQQVLVGRGLRWVRCSELSEIELDHLLFGDRRSGSGGLLNTPSVGTIVLQEVAAISPAVQLRLLDRMRGERFQTHGGEGPCLTFTTTEDLGRLVASRRVRADLFYELSGYLIGLAPLRFHASDIPLFVDYVLESLAAACRVIQIKPLRLGTSLLENLILQPWPGNVAQLRQFLFRAAVQSAASEMGRDDWVRLMSLGAPRHRGSFAEGLPAGGFAAGLAMAGKGAQKMLQGWTPRVVPDIRHEGAHEVDRTSADAAILVTTKWSELVDCFTREGATNIYARALEQFERGLLSEVLGRTGGNLNDSARLLGMTRVSLRNKLQSLAIPFQQ